MKNFLRASSAAMGEDPERGAIELIQSMIGSTIKSSEETKVNYEASANKPAAKTGESSGTPQNLEQAALIVSGRGVPRTWELNLGLNYPYTVEGLFYQTPATKKDNQPINESMTL
ncbi:MAG: hypothetical protein Nk1A_7800 [Endomicrobiia bacterium]|nr:MAG: hypothetical protein Nk1A_7800 [Endomicrobiia bacterium]